MIRRFFLSILFIIPLVTHAEEFPHRFEGSGSCAASTCHGGVDNKNNQYTLWATSDKHSKAYDVLFSEKSKRMVKILGLKDASTEKTCLTCHGNPVPEDKQGKKFDPHEGVSCERCHGASENWLESHAQKGQTHTQNVALGLTDLNNIPTRAKTCLSCHSGLDHKTYSAGHPELTFELDTFSAIMPRHWEKTKKWEGADNWLFGQVTSLQKELELILNHTKLGRLDESGMKCVSCHHNLFDTQYSLADDANGRAPFTTSHWAVIQNYFELVLPEENKKLDVALTRLRQAYREENPNLNEVKSAVNDALEIINHSESKIKSYGWSAGFIRALMEKISSEGELFAKDGFRTAEQSAMALDALNQAVLTELGEKNWISISTKPLLDALDVSDPARFNPDKFTNALKTFHAKLTKAAPLPTIYNKQDSVQPSTQTSQPGLWNKTIEKVKEYLKK